MEESVEYLVQKVKEEMFSPSADIYSFVPVSAYDTAWVAMVPHPQHPQRPMFPDFLDWILSNQKDGGFWGEPDECSSILPNFECLTATLACLVALHTWNAGSLNVKKGLEFLHSKIENLLLTNIKQHGNTPRWFSIIFPGMLELAKAKGLDVFPDGFMEVVKHIVQERDKIVEIEESTDDGCRNPGLHLYMEALPTHYKAKHELLMLRHQSKDGSMFQSPSATACALMITGDKGCMAYLEAMVQRCRYGAPPTYPVDEELIKLCLIDHIQRLGCSEHFTKEITEEMNRVYRNWLVKVHPTKVKYGVELQIYKDSLAFQLLRIHNHCVSPGRFCWFVHDEEMLFYIEENYISFKTTMYNVYRASHLLFSNEPDLEKAKNFSRMVLEKDMLHDNINNSDATRVNVQTEIEHELKLPWLARMEFLEDRMYIERRGSYCLPIGKASSCRLSFPNNPIQLRLAKKSFSIRQSVYQTELEEIKRWSKNSGLSNMGFGREKTTYAYFAIAVMTRLPLKSDVRKVVAKCAILIIVADDFFDENGPLDELHDLTEAVQRWQGGDLYGHSRVIFNALDDLVSDIALKSFAQQGHDIRRILQDIRWTWLLFEALNGIKHLKYG